MTRLPGSSLLVLGLVAAVTAGQDLDLCLKPLLADAKVPALAGAWLSGDGGIAVGAVGRRRRDATVPVTHEDLWHLGSCTKAFTATLVGTLVESGRLAWDTPLEAVFPDWAPRFHPDLRGVTVSQLLAHCAGLPRDLDLGVYAGPEGPRLRRRAVRDELQAAPRYPPGTAVAYSNLGYIVLGAIIERVTDQPWRTALTDRVLEPLGLHRTGFGGVGTPGRLDQPWGHDPNGTPVAGNGPRVDNPPVMEPAGGLHAPLADWARFVRDQLRGAQGRDGLLRADTYRRLHTPVQGDFGLGWRILKRPWAGGRVLHHTGSNTMNYANVWIAPERDIAFLACANQGGDRGFAATDSVIAALIRLTRPTPSSPTPPCPADAPGP